MQLSKFDRLILVNQFRILEKLYPEDAAHMSVQREALERGYEMLYAWDMDFVYDGDDKMSEEESREVWDTMDMFYSIDIAISLGLDTSPYKLTKFQGYDGNNEGKFLGFAQFTVERLKRFEYLPMEREGYWNSHAPYRATYQRMLEEWRKIPAEKRFDLDQEELTRVLAAAVHPENR